MKADQNETLVVSKRVAREVSSVAKARPVTFAGCAGMLHPARGSTAIVMVGSFGYEALASHKSLRLLAEQLAAAGFPCLRFDFPGTGDSAGDETGANLIETRRASVIDACDFLRTALNVETIVLLGFRLGASIAVLAASASRASCLVLVEPPVTGRTWLRELELLPRLSGVAVAEHASTEKSKLREYMGYPMSEASHASIRSLDLREVSPRGVSRCLVMSGGAGRALADCISNWRAGGIHVDQTGFADFSAMMADPSTGAAPTGSFQPIPGWLGQPHPSGSSMAIEKKDAVLALETCTERAVCFGAAERCFGILCEPHEAASSRPVVILPNTGGNLHTGWGRQTVELARHLAGLGVASFRIDVNGIGETADLPGRPERLVYVPSSSEDVVAAVDYLQGLQYRTVAVVGICSGAYLAYQACLRSSRIGAIQLINLQKFEWTESDELVLYRSVGSYLAMLTSPDVWRRIRTGEVNLGGIAAHVARKMRDKFKVRLGIIFSGLRLNTGPRVQTPLDKLRQHLESGMAVSIVYTDADGGIDEAEAFLGRRGRFLSGHEKFSMETVSGSGHNFETAADRSRLLAIVGTFAERLMRESAVPQDDSHRDGHADSAAA